MHKQGSVVGWDETKGFGFIRSPQTAEDVFFHIRDWEGLNPPALHMAVGFEEIRVGGKGPRAMSVAPLDGPTVPKSSREALRREREAIRERVATQAGALDEPPPRHIARSPAAQARAARRARWLMGSLAGLFGLWLILLLAGIWMRRMPWVVLPEGAKAVPEFYEVTEVWPAASRERVRAMRRRLKEAAAPDASDPGS